MADSLRSTLLSTLSLHFLASYLSAASLETSDMRMKFREFCDTTGMHGWKHVGKVRNNQIFPLRSFLIQLTSKEQFAWILILVASLGVAFFFIATAIIDFNSSTVVTTIQTTTAPLSEVFFPTVIVCNINQIRNSFLNVIIDLNLLPVSLNKNFTLFNHFLVNLDE